MNENISQDLLINNRYRLTRKLGEGSFGEVWLSEDTPSPAVAAHFPAVHCNLLPIYSFI